MSRTRGPKTRWDLALQLLVIAVPYVLLLASAIREISRGRPGTIAIFGPALVVLLAGLVGSSAWVIREYARWSRGIRPAPPHGPGSAFARREVELPPELLRTPRALPAWARPRRGVAAAVAVAALLVNGVFSLANDGGNMLRAALACTGAVIAVALPSLVLRRARRHLLARGTAVVATVSDVTSYKGSLSISYDFDTPGGRRTGTTTVEAWKVVSRYGGWPEIGDPALVVHDPDALVKSTLWSLPARRPRPEPGPASLAHVAAWVVAVLLFIGVYLLFARR